MNFIIDKGQWNGWFGGLGAAGVVLQNVITTIMPFIIAGLAIWMVVIIGKAGVALSGAASPEARKEARIKLAFAIVGLVIIVAGPTLVLIFMNTLGKTTQTAARTTSTTTKASMALEWARYVLK